MKCEWVAMQSNAEPGYIEMHFIIIADAVDWHLVRCSACIILFGCN